MVVLGVDVVQMETVQAFPHEYSTGESDDKVSFIIVSLLPNSLLWLKMLEKIKKGAVKQNDIIYYVYITSIINIIHRKD